jgi:imidazolonepropionase-like amidohydrolase
MKVLLFCVFFLFQHLLIAQNLPVSNAKREIVFRDVNVIPMDSERMLQHQVVVVKAGKISAIGSIQKIKYNKDAIVIEAKDKFLIPGLAEMHAHIPPIDDLEPMKEVLTLFAVNGITTIRGMLGHPKHLEVRSMLQKGELVGPQLYTTGPSFNGMSITSPESGAAMVRKQKEAGYDFLKLHPGLNRDEFDAIAATAHELKIPFAGHVSFGVGVWRAIEAKYSSIDHLDGFIEGLVPGIEKLVEQQAGLFGMFVAEQADTTQIPKLTKALKNNEIWVVPTQSLAERWFHPDYTAEKFKSEPYAVYMKPETVDQWISSKQNLINNPSYNADKIKDFVALRRKLILECQRNGVGILLGCDAPQIFNVPGFSTHQELQYLVLAGLTPYEALQAGTVNVGKYLKLNDHGTIRQNAVSDLILLNGNPLTDINETMNIAGVMLGTQWLSKEHINEAILKLRKSN